MPVKAGYTKAQKKKPPQLVKIEAQIRKPKLTTQKPAAQKEPHENPPKAVHTVDTKKTALCLSITREQRAALNEISAITGKSISELVGSWAQEELFKYKRGDR